MTTTHTEIMQAAGNLHDQLRNTSFGQAQDIFDDSAPFHTSNDVFHDNADTGDQVIEQLVSYTQLLTSGLFLGCWGRLPAGS